MIHGYYPSSTFFVYRQFDTILYVPGLLLLHWETVIYILKYIKSALRKKVFSLFCMKTKVILQLREIQIVRIRKILTANNKQRRGKKKDFFVFFYKLKLRKKKINKRLGPLQQGWFPYILKNTIHNPKTPYTLFLFIKLYKDEFLK